MERPRSGERAELLWAQSTLMASFSPSGPINRRDLFAGRIDQIKTVLRAISQRAQHVVLFGERGVGKTSFASLIHDFWTEVFQDESGLVVARVNADTTDNFDTIWSKIAGEIRFIHAKRGEDFPPSES